MASRPLPNNFTIRKNFGKIEKILEFPDLIEIQKSSYERFLQAEVPPSERENTGLQGVFKEIFPIKDFNESAALEFVSYHLEQPKYDVEECHQRGMTYSAPMKVTARLVVYWDKDPETGERAIRDVKEQEIYFGDIPLITETGTFIINGTERVVVSQLHRSPGAFFEHDKGKTHASEKLIYAARIIPYRGSWLDFEFDLRDIIHVRIDRRRKMHATILLKALGYSTQDLLNYYYHVEKIICEGKSKYKKRINFEILQGQFATRDIKHPQTGEVLIAKNRKFTRRTINDLKAAKITEIPIDEDELVGKISANDIIDPETGEALLKCNEEINKKKLAELIKAGITEFDILYIDKLNVGSYLRDTLAADGVNSTEEAILSIYKKLRPGEPTTFDTAKRHFENLFFNPERYDLGQVGRLKLNHKFNLEESITTTVLTKEDILEVVRYLIDLKNGRGSVDDIDHLGNRRVRSVGELLENQFRIGLVRMERAIREKMSLQEMETVLPHDLINSKPVSAVVKEFFGSSQLSQFMDQTNPLSEITHKRRLSALGPGGLTRERAGFEVRDVHPTHYGRICPVETPEGPNIGLIASLSTYARVTKFGFVETPYRKVEKGVVTSQVDYYSALQEENQTIAQANTKVDNKNKFVDNVVAARQRQGDLVMVPPEEVSLMDVSPNQIVSAAASLIPFLEHDDANRALMGSNMQRQAVPLIRTESPLVGTGMEKTVAQNSGVTITARRSGVVQAVDALRIVIRSDEEGKSGNQDMVDVYSLIKFQRSNQSTCLNQKPLVQEGQRVAAGEVIADGAATDKGELALGKNMIVAFMPWGGYNFEDSILINERVVKEDSFTSIHIEEYECIARDTKLGKEEITRDIPNVGDDALRNLDESGIIRIGAEVKTGDILVGKITPKGETQLSPEEKLLRAIFGEKAGDVRDTSLRVPPGVSGTIINAKVFLRKGTEKDARTLAIELEEESRVKKNLNDKISVTRQTARQKAEKILIGQTTNSRVTGDNKKQLIAKGVKLDAATLAEVPDKYLDSITIGNEKKENQVKDIMAQAEEQIALYTSVYEEKIKRIKKGDELPPGVIKMVKVFIAIKRKLQVGDKMAGRHGNKGVISRILPSEDMPFLADGTPVDIALNPLGVPSRMNVGQVLETHLGWAAYGVGKKVGEMAEALASPESIRKALQTIYTDKDSKAAIAELSEEQVLELARKLKKGVRVSTPVFDGAKENEIVSILKEAGLEENGQTILFDGRTGEPFSTDVTVGIMYMLKLHHLVEDKIHARSIGPYSLVTQQPLGGKAQFGGQRLGEMEVWAIEAYGAAHTLREFLTVKSDDVVGRTKMFEAIVKGEHLGDIGIPESFNVLIKEMQSLALNVELLEKAASQG